MPFPVRKFRTGVATGLVPVERGWFPAPRVHVAPSPPGKPGGDARTELVNRKRHEDLGREL